MNEQAREGTIRVVALGDVVGKPGRNGVRETIKRLRAKSTVHLMVVNGENSAGGLGIDPECAHELRSFGADVITLGDHTWQKREIRPFLDQNSEWIIRPHNYPVGAPGRGWTIRTVRHQGGEVKVGVMNLIGRVYIGGALDCPFRAANHLIDHELAAAPVRICDLHAEVTSEKVAMGRHLDGRCSLVYGTHTHIQTADEQILPAGTGYLTDLGMSGSNEGVIGMDKEVALERFITGLPASYKVAKGSVIVSGVACDIDVRTGKAVHIERVREAVEFD